MLKDTRSIEIGWCETCKKQTDHKDGALVAECMKCGRVREPIDRDKKRD